MMRSPERLSHTRPALPTPWLCTKAEPREGEIIRGVLMISKSKTRFYTYLLLMSSSLARCAVRHSLCPHSARNKPCPQPEPQVIRCAHARYARRVPRNPRAHARAARPRARGKNVQESSLSRPELRFTATSPLALQYRPDLLLGVAWPCCLKLSRCEPPTCGRKWHRGLR